jgi:hypothetical protein
VNRSTAHRLHLPILWPIGVFFAGSVAVGQPQRHFALTWQAPADCPEASAVTREIDELLATSSAPTPRSMILGEAAVMADKGGYTLTLSIRDHDGSHQRRLEAPNCSELAHAAALIVGLAIDPALLASHPDPGGAMPNPRASETTLPSNASAANAPRPPVVIHDPSTPAPPNVFLPRAEPNPPLMWRLGLVEFLGIATLPGVHLGTGLFGALQWQAWRLETSVSELSGQTAKDQRMGAKFSLYRFTTRGCWLVSNPRWAFGPCSGVEVGNLRGEGYGVDQPGKSSRVWFGAALGALADWRLGSSSVLSFVADAEIPWVREQYQLAGLDFYKPPPVAARLGVSLSAGWR